MKNIGQYNQDLSVPRKKDIDSLEARVKTNEDNIAMAESDIEGLNTDVGTLKTDVSSVKTALNSKQDTIVGAASTIVENNLTAGKVLVSDASGKVGADASISNTSDVITMNKRLIAQYNILCTNNEKIVELDTDTFSYPAVRFGQNASTKAIKIFGEVEDKVVEFSTESEDFVTLRGVADATEKSDAVNLSQLNSSLGNYVSKVGTNGQTIASSFEAANSIKAQTGGEVNNTIELLSSDVAPSLVATSGGKGMSVSFVPQYSEVSFNMDDNVTLTGIKAGTNDTDAVNVGQLNATIAAAGGLKASDILFVYVAINRLVGSVAPFGNGLYLHTITSYRSLTITVKDGPTVATNELQAIVPLFSSGSISARDISIRFFDNYITSIDYLASVSDIPESLTIWCYAVKK